VLLAQAISHGVEPPEYLEPGLLIRGAVHQIFAGPASGKTWLALLLIRNAFKRGLTVAFFDTENGERIISERLATLGVDVSTVDDLLFYYPSPSLDLSAANSFAEFLDTVKPDLIVFDSWLDHLASANLSENESTDIAKWAGVLRQAVLPRLREFGPPAHREF
jgi:RecA/RadA recombinase